MGTLNPATRAFGEAPCVAAERVRAVQIYIRARGHANPATRPSVELPLGPRHV